MSLADESKSKMGAAVEHFKTELKGLRSSRAQPALLDVVVVEVYGSPMPIKNLAHVTAPESRQLLVSPFDPQTVAAIAKGIERANLGVMPIVEGNAIRVSIPPMDEDRRKKTVQQGKKMAEEAKIAVREVRRKYNELVRKQKADGDITEDVMKKQETLIQTHTDQMIKEIDALFAAKEKEILTV